MMSQVSTSYAQSQCHLSSRLRPLPPSCRKGAHVAVQRQVRMLAAAADESGCVCIDHRNTLEFVLLLEAWNVQATCMCACVLLMQVVC
jgi:hypothetical protein